MKSLKYTQISEALGNGSDLMIYTDRLYHPFTYLYLAPVGWSGEHIYYKKSKRGTFIPVQGTEESREGKVFHQ